MPHAGNAHVCVHGSCRSGTTGKRAYRVGVFIDLGLELGHVERHIFRLGFFVALGVVFVCRRPRVGAGLDKRTDLVLDALAHLRLSRGGGQSVVGWGRGEAQCAIDLI